MLGSCDLHQVDDREEDDPDEVDQVPIGSSCLDPYNIVGTIRPSACLPPEVEHDPDSKEHMQVMHGEQLVGVGRRTQTPPGEGIFAETVGVSTPTNRERSTT